MAPSGGRNFLSKTERGKGNPVVDLRADLPAGVSGAASEDLAGTAHLCLPEYTL